MELLKINLTEIIRKRAGKKGRFIPRFMLRALEKFICQDELNKMLEATYPLEGSGFARAIYDHLGLSLELRGVDNIPSSGRFIFASNHPLGGLDGIGLIAFLGEKYGDENLRFLVNDMLMNIEPLRNVFLPINKFGAQGKTGAALINEAYASDCQIAIFPAGLCSRLGSDGQIRDLKWNKSFVAKAIEYQRDIIPIFFDGENSSRFYRSAYWRKRLNIKVNLEQALLPSELCRARGKHFSITFGTPITWQSLRDSEKTPLKLAQEIKSQAYSLKN